MRQFVEKDIRDSEAFYVSILGENLS